MTGQSAQPIAVIGVSAILPDAPDAAAFWANLQAGRYSITDIPPGRWDPELYYDSDPRAPDKTYSRIGGWVRDFPWDPIGWRLPLPPAVTAQFDAGHKWSVAASRGALADAGWPQWHADPDRVAVIIGNALAGDKHYDTHLRISYPEYARSLAAAGSFAALPDQVRDSVLAEAKTSFLAGRVEITEDTMPGELANIIAGRVANLFNLRGPNFTTDAACASALAGTATAVRGLRAGDFDVAITGGVDSNMGTSAFVKFCKIGALSATGSRPYDARADGFVMGEGAALLVLKRLADAERDGDRIYAVILGIGGSSDGRGKGITAPNPVGQQLAIERAWRDAAADPADATYLEGHGTSTRVGDAAELAALAEVFAKAGAAPGSIALGSVKSNIGHLKAAAGAAGLLKTVLCLRSRLLVPSLNFEVPNPEVDWATSPFRVSTELREWPAPSGNARLAGVSAFGFGGTDFHAVLEEYIPGRHRPEGTSRSYATGAIPAAGVRGAERRPPATIAMVGAPDDTGARSELERLAAGEPPCAPDAVRSASPVRAAIRYGNRHELASMAAKAVAAFQDGAPAVRRMLRSRGTFVRRGQAPKVAFLFPGQGSQYVNMLRTLRRDEPVVAETFAEADRIVTPLLGTSLTGCIFTDETDQAAIGRLEQQLLRTEITQPAVLTADVALTRLLATYGMSPDMVMGHSLGEYAALVAAGAMSFGAALEAVGARAREMADLAADDPGQMAAVHAPPAVVERIIAEAGGYLVVANVNSTSQVVVGGATAAVERAVEMFRSSGFTADLLPVSHAFHTSIVSPAAGPLKAALRRLGIRPPVLPVVSDVTGEFYPEGADAGTVVDLLGRQVASPVQFVPGLRTLYAAGARVFVEVGPKRALHGFVEDVLASQHDDVLSLSTNHPRLGDVTSFEHALCGLYAAGLGFPGGDRAAGPAPASPAGQARPERAGAAAQAGTAERARPSLWPGAASSGTGPEPVVVTGAALGLPGTNRVFDDGNLARILDGQQFIEAIPHRLRRKMVDRHITRLVKEESGDARFETIGSEADVIKLAARSGDLDVVSEFGVDAERDAALDRSTRLAIGAGFDAVRDAGIPFVQRYRMTSSGSSLPGTWGLPEPLRDDTGIIFASALPGYDSFAQVYEEFTADRGRREQLRALDAIRARMDDHDAAAAETDRRIRELRKLIESRPFALDRRFLFRCLPMGHAQFAELIGARGPSTHVNAACASTTQALCMAEDWIRTGRCRRVVVISADDLTTDALLPWIGSGFLAAGAAATDDIVEDAATPFDRRRHGMILGMGAAAFVVESAAAARERGIHPICEVLGAVTANSAYHGTRLDPDHISGVMEDLIRHAEAHGVTRQEIAAAAAFVSHETYTPARGGSAAAEVGALRRTFGAAADSIIITNTKGFTGHAIGAGIEDVVAIKALETGIVPPIPNFEEPDPELGTLNLSVGGAYPIRYAIRLAAGFGSQIAMALLRWTPVPGGRRPAVDELGYAYRIADLAAWQGWLAAAAGRPDARLEVTHRQLRIAADGVPSGAADEVPPGTADRVPRRPADAGLPLGPAPEAVTAQPAATVPPAEHRDGRDTHGQDADTHGRDGTDPVGDAVVEIVAEMTGYPAELLERDLDLEADLGVDTVKQAEVFAAIRDRFAIGREETLRLRDFPTLDHVIGWVRERSDGAGEAPGHQAATPIAPPADAEGAADPVGDAVVEIVAEMTGYPAELLERDLDLEADLGVDTVKQAEVFAAIRDRFAIGREETLRLRDFPTLDHVIGWVRERSDGAGEAGPQASGAATGPGGGVTDGISRKVPVPVLRPALSLCKPTGITLGPGRRVAVMPDTGGVAAVLAARLRKLGCEVLMLDPAASPDDLIPDGDVQGIYWLPALDDEGPLTELDPQQWRGAVRRRVKNLYAVVRRLYDQEPFLVAGTRLGGYHGYGAEGATAPLGGAVAGFAKAYRRERPGALVKVVDFPAAGKKSAVAQALVEETLRDPSCMEAGHADGLRWTVGLAERPFGPENGTLGPDTVFLVTGAAGSIVSAITADLAAASAGVFHLIDITPPPDPGDAIQRRLIEDREGLRAEITARLRGSGVRPTPVLIDSELARYERLNAASAAIEAIRAAGGTAYYHCADLTDADAVCAVLEDVRATSGRVDILLHAAGTEVSRPLPGKQPGEFDRVFDVKADGWYNLLHAATDLPVGCTVVFSSVSGRFGNAGQADYSAANGLLCTMTSAMRRQCPGTRAIAVDWTAWAGIGMASRGSTPKIMAAAGIQMLPPQVGVPWIRNELTRGGGGGGEVVAAGALGVLTAEPDQTGGLDPAAVQAAGPMTDSAIPGHDGLVSQVTLDPVAQPFLNDHRIDGIPVLPGVMGIEAFAEAACLLAPGWQVRAIENAEFLAPVKFFRGEPRTLTVRAIIRPDGAGLTAGCALEAERILAGGEVRRSTHFTASLRLGRNSSESGHGSPVAEHGDGLPRAAVYSVYFHGPAYQVVGTAWGHADGVIARLADDLPPGHLPAGTPTVLPVRLIELCFQAAGIREIAAHGRLALPQRIERMSLLAAAAEPGPRYAVATERADGGFDCAALGPAGALILRIEGYRTAPLGEAPAGKADQFAATLVR